MDYSGYIKLPWEIVLGLFPLPAGKKQVMALLPVGRGYSSTNEEDALHMEGLMFHLWQLQSKGSRDNRTGANSGQLLLLTVDDTGLESLII